MSTIDREGDTDLKPKCDCFDKVCRWFDQMGPLRVPPLPTPKLCASCKKEYEKANRK